MSRATFRWKQQPKSDEDGKTQSDELAAYKLAQLPFPGVGACPERSRRSIPVFYQSDRPTKNALEKRWIDNIREKVGNASDLELLQKTFDRMK